MSNEQMNVNCDDLSGNEHETESVGHTGENDGSSPSDLFTLLEELSAMEVNGDSQSQYIDELEFSVNSIEETLRGLHKKSDDLLNKATELEAQYQQIWNEVLNMPTELNEAINREFEDN